MNAYTSTWTGYTITYEPPILSAESATLFNAAAIALEGDNFV